MLHSRCRRAGNEFPLTYNIKTLHLYYAESPSVYVVALINTKWRRVWKRVVWHYDRSYTKKFRTISVRDPTVSSGVSYGLYVCRTSGEPLAGYRCARSSRCAIWEATTDKLGSYEKSSSPGSINSCGQWGSRMWPGTTFRRQSQFGAGLTCIRWEPSKTRTHRRTHSHTYTHRLTERDRHTSTHTHTQTDTHTVTDRHTHRYTYTHFTGRHTHVHIHARARTHTDTYKQEVPVVSLLSLQEMDPVTRVQILDETDCISHRTNTLGKGMNPIILPAAMGK